MLSERRRADSVIGVEVHIRLHTSGPGTEEPRGSECCSATAFGLPTVGNCESGIHLLTGAASVVTANTLIDALLRPVAPKEFESPQVSAMNSGPKQAVLRTFRWDVPL